MVLACFCICRRVGMCGVCTSRSGKGRLARKAPRVNRSDSSRVMMPLQSGPMMPGDTTD